MPEVSAAAQPIKGIKGVSTLLGMDWFNIVDGLGQDYMHGILLGVTEAPLFSLFFKAAFFYCITDQTH